MCSCAPFEGGQVCCKRPWDAGVPLARPSMDAATLQAEDSDERPGDVVRVAVV